MKKLIKRLDKVIGDAEGDFSTIYRSEDTKKIYIHDIKKLCSKIESVADIDSKLFRLPYPMMCVSGGMHELDGYTSFCIFVRLLSDEEIDNIKGRIDAPDVEMRFALSGVVHIEGWEELIYTESLVLVIDENVGSRKVLLNDDLDEGSRETLLALLNMFVKIIALINEKQVIVEESLPSGRSKMIRRKHKKGVPGGFSTLRLPKPSEVLKAKREASEPTGRKMPKHWRKGHLRRLKGDKFTWVKPSLINKNAKVFNNKETHVFTE